MISEGSLYHYWRVLNRRKGVIFLSLAASVATSVVYVSFQPVVYEVSVMLKVQSRPAEEQSAALSPASYALRSLTSSDVAERAARKLGLFGADTSPSHIALVTSEVSSAYSVASLEEAGLIRLSVRLGNRIAAAELANALAESYQEYDLEEAGKQVKTSLQNIEKRMEQIKQGLAEAEAHRQHFLETNGSPLSSDLMTAKLNDLQLKKKDLLGQYTEQHPDVIEISRRIRELEEKMARMPAKETELNRLTREVRTNEDLFATLSKQYEETKIEVNSLSSVVQIVDPAVPPRSPISPNRSRSYGVAGGLGFILGIILAFFFENLDLSINTIEDIENFIQLPVLALIPNLAAFVPHHDWRRRFWPWGQRSKITNSIRLLVLNNDAKARLAEPYHTLRVNIFSKLPVKGRGIALAFASATEGEGKTLGALNVAFTAASAGSKVLLIDTDMRRACVHNILGLPQEPGFADVVAGKVDWRAAVRATADFLIAGRNPDKVAYFPGIDNIKILTAGMRTHNAMGILANERISALVDEWKNVFDLIIFDTPPVLIYGDVLLLLRRLDAAVLFYGAGQITRMALKRAKEQLQTCGKDKILGIAISYLHAADTGTLYSTYQYQ